MWPSDFSFKLRTLAARLQQQHGDLFVFEPTALRPLLDNLHQVSKEAGLPHAPVELIVDDENDLMAHVYWPGEREPHWSILVAKDGDIYAGPSGRPWDSEKCSWPERDRMVQDRHRWVLRARQHIITMLAHWQDYLASSVTPAAAAASDNKTRKEVRGELLKIMESGEPFSSKNKLAKRISCSPHTLKRAIDELPKLQNWERAEAFVTNGRNVQTTEGVQVPAAKETAPLSDDEYEKYMQEITADCTEDELRNLEELSEVQRRHMAVLYRDREWQAGDKGEHERQTKAYKRI